MSIAQFLAQAKTGLPGGVLDGNIKKYSMLGSQNAIIQTPVITSDGGTQTELIPRPYTPAVPTTFQPGLTPGTPFQPGTRPILRGATLNNKTNIQKPIQTPESAFADLVAAKVLAALKHTELAPSSGTSGGGTSGGGTGGTAPGEIANDDDVPHPNTKEPNDKPPFDVLNDAGNKEFQEYAKYLVKRYGRIHIQKDIDDLLTESAAFSLAVQTIKQMERAIEQFENNPYAKAQQIMLNISDVLIKFFLPKIIDLILGSIADYLPPVPKDITDSNLHRDTKINELVKEGMNEIKNIILSTIGIKSDFVSGLRNAIDKIFELGDKKNAWKKKYAVMKAEWLKKRAEMDKIQQEAKNESDAFLSSPEGKEYTAFANAHPSGKDIMAKTKKYDEMKKKYKERLERQAKASKEEEDNYGPSGGGWQ